ncbi:hypothetical protein Acf1_00012 [Acidovorax phage ACF1]|nr:hypothetical protein Acf1_00012 [Acidovorax phage ACF1]
MGLKNTSLDDISAVVGFSATLNLVAWFGDAGNLYVPVQVAEDQLLVKLIGFAAARRLSEEWPGEHINVPRLSDYEIDLRRGTIAKLLQREVSTREISHILSIGERRVQQVCRELETAGLIPVVGPAKPREKVLREMGAETIAESWGGKCG